MICNKFSLKNLSKFAGTGRPCFMIIKGWKNDVLGCYEHIFPLFNKKEHGNLKNGEIHNIVVHEKGTPWWAGRITPSSFVGCHLLQWTPSRNQGIGIIIGFNNSKKKWTKADDNCPQMHGSPRSVFYFIFAAANPGKNNSKCGVFGGIFSYNETSKSRTIYQTYWNN